MAEKLPESADVVIVNTCAVTAEAERQGRQALRRARRENAGGARPGDVQRAEGRLPAAGGQDAAGKADAPQPKKEA